MVPKLRFLPEASHALDLSKFPSEVFRKIVLWLLTIFGHISTWFKFVARSRRLITLLSSRTPARKLNGASPIVIVYATELYGIRIFQLQWLWNQTSLKNMVASLLKRLSNVQAMLIEDRYPSMEEPASVCNDSLKAISSHDVHKINSRIMAGNSQSSYLGRNYTSMTSEWSTT